MSKGNLGHKIWNKPKGSGARSPSHGFVPEWQSTVSRAVHIMSTLASNLAEISHFVIQCRCLWTEVTSRGLLVISYNRFAKNLPISFLNDNLNVALEIVIHPTTMRVNENLSTQRLVMRTVLRTQNTAT